MASIMTELLGGRVRLPSSMQLLILEPDKLLKIDDEYHACKSLPSPEDLKYKILVRVKAFRIVNAVSLS